MHSRAKEPRWTVDDVMRRVTVVGDCWEWNGPRTEGGYGTAYGTTAHRWVYRCLIGPIPPGLQLDHVKARGCRSRACVNPDHLEPVTCRENLMRGDTVTAARAAQTHCVRGHALDEANTRIRPNGTRACRACSRDDARQYAARRRAATPRHPRRVGRVPNGPTEQVVRWLDGRRATAHDVAAGTGLRLDQVQGAAKYLRRVDAAHVVGEQPAPRGGPARKMWELTQPAAAFLDEYLNAHEDGEL